MDISVNIKCPDLVTASENFAGAIIALLESNRGKSPVLERVAVAEVNPVHADTTPATTTVNPTPSPVMTTPGVAQTAPTPVAVPTTPAPGITGDMVAKAGADLIAANPAAMAQLNALLQKYGVGCAQELRPDQIGPFATEMRALGARI